MPAIPILNGLYTDASADWRIAYPRNLVPTLRDTGISKGYLRSADGLVQTASTSGLYRNGINWNGAFYAVIGTKFCKVSETGSIDELGTITGSDWCRLDYSFDRIAIAADHALWYWTGTELVKVTDSDVGGVLDVLWVDGYFMTTDGQYIPCSEINDPASFLPTRYGSSESDPDSITALRKVRNEVHVLNRYSIEVLENVGGSGFPFQRIPGSVIDRGCIGRDACAYLRESLAFVGSRRNEPVGVWLLAGGSSSPLSTPEIDKVLRGYGEDVLASCVVETRIEDKRATLLIHLPDQTLAYDDAMSQAVGSPVWYILSSSASGYGEYRAKGLVWCYDRWNFGDTQANRLGTFSSSTDLHWGSHVGWEFVTLALYADNHNVQVHALELVALPGRSPVGSDPVVWHSYSRDGFSFSTERATPAGKTGSTQTNIQWRRLGFCRNWRVERFRGADTGPVSFARLEADVEALNE